MLYNVLLRIDIVSQHKVPAEIAGTKLFGDTEFLPRICWLFVGFTVGRVMEL